jgi:hypothetical protein
VSGVVSTIVYVPESASKNFETAGTITAGTSSKTIIATFNTTPAATTVVNGLTTTMATSSYLASQSSVSIYAAYGYKLKNSFILALMPYILVI